MRIDHQLPEQLSLAPGYHSCDGFYYQGSHYVNYQECFTPYYPVSTVPGMLAKRLKDLRSSVGWSQKELAEQAHVSQQLIAKIENGLVRETRKLPLIAKAFGLTVEQMLAASAPTAHPPVAQSTTSSLPYPLRPEFLGRLNEDQLLDLAGMVEDRVARMKVRGGVKRPKKLTSSRST
jgi:transcriptional regulator with XRE-family HTH domain